jgi:hypothetical protein
LPLDEVADLAEDFGAKNVRYFEDQLDELLAACDVLISASSTTILEATLIGRKSICVNFSGEPDDYPYVDEGVSLPAKSIAELRDAVNRATSQDVNEAVEARRTEFLWRHLGPSTSGQAAECLARKVLSLCGQSGDDRDILQPSGEDVLLGTPQK